MSGQSSGLFKATKDDIDKERENQSMEVGHDDKADDSDNNADELNFFIGRNATCEVVGDFLIKDGDGGASGKN